MTLFLSSNNSNLFQNMLTYCKSIPNWNEKNNKKDWNCSYQFNMSDSTARCSNSSKRKIWGGGGHMSNFRRECSSNFSGFRCNKILFLELSDVCVIFLGKHKFSSFLKVVKIRVIKVLHLTISV